MLSRRRFLWTAAASGAGAIVATPVLLQAQPALAAGTQATVTTDVNVRGGPSVHQPVVASLPVGLSVALLAPAAAGAWWRVASDGGVGYVSAEFLQATVNQPPAASSTSTCRFPTRASCRPSG